MKRFEQAFDLLFIFANMINLRFPKKNTPRWIIFMIDLLIGVFSLLIAYLIRFDSTNIPLDVEKQMLLPALPFYFLIKSASFLAFGTYRGIVRHTSTHDNKKLFFAATTSTMIFLLLSPIRANYLDGNYFLPMSVIVIEYIASIFFMSTFRFAVKLVFLESQKSYSKTQSILIYGAGISGLIAKRTIEKDERIRKDIKGFVDDNAQLKGKALEGIKIFNTQKLDTLIKENEIEELIIAIQNPEPSNRKKVIETCLQNDVKVRTVPNPKAWINGEFTINQIKSVKIEDLLGRDAIQLDKALISDKIDGKTILISGAAGSIGSGIVKELTRFKPAKLILLDQAESALYDLEIELNGKIDQFNIDIFIGDIRSIERMRNLFNSLQPQVVYHAAAYKHVPLMEDNPSEAILTNVKGTKNLVDLSMEFNVEKFVMVSTDKAVNPTNVMGASKRIAEIYAQSANQHSSTKFITTRFGNVLGSNGSVIPLFKRQIESGGPVTVTDKRITRYFMTIPEACQLVIEAGAMGTGGEIFIFDMGESVKIIDLAKKMIQLSGLKLGKDIEIKYTGLRPGEKLFEELLSNEENTTKTHHPKIMIAKVKPQTFDNIQREMDKLIDLFNGQNNFDIVQKMKNIVPEFKSNNSVYSKLDHHNEKHHTNPNKVL